MMDLIHMLTDPMKLASTAMDLLKNFEGGGLGKSLAVGWLR
jgi:hypothetical protein